MYSITEFLGGTSNIAVEHPEICNITYNLEAKFYFKSFISEEVRTAESSSSLSLRGLTNCSRQSCQHVDTITHESITGCRSHKGKINLLHHLLIFTKQKMNNWWRLVCLVKKYRKIYNDGHKIMKHLKILV